ncbi:MAG: hypothetical protein KA210_02675 [Bacteroidia bacterium]|jgi:hypothetical protein|nr:hypothetical protein [Bacteroidia bacterium]
MKRKQILEKSFDLKMVKGGRLDGSTFRMCRERTAEDAWNCADYNQTTFDDNGKVLESVKIINVD